MPSPLKRYKPILWILLSVSLSILFINPLAVRNDLYDPTQMGQILFFAEFFSLLSPLFILYQLYRLNEKPDVIQVLALLLFLWICVRGKEGGVLYDDKFFYFSGCFSIFFIARLLLKDILRNTSENYQYYILPILVVIAIVAGTEAAIGQLQVLDLHRGYNNNYKVMGTFFNPAPYAGFLVVSLPWALYLITLRNKNILLIILSVLGFLLTVLILVILPSTYSRAGYVGLVTSLIVWALYRYKPILFFKRILDTQLKKIIATALLSFIILIGGIGMYQLKRDSAFGRTLIWKVAFLSVKERPLEGHGFNSFQATFAPSQATYFSTGQRSNYEKTVAGNVRWAFNEPLQVMVELGLAGGVLLLAIISYGFFSIRQSNLSKEKVFLLASAKASLAGITAFSFFSYPFHSLPCTLCFFFSLSVLSAFSKDLGNKTLAITLNSLSLVSIFLVSIYYYNGIPKIKSAYKQWKEAEGLYKIEEYGLANEVYSGSRPTLKFNGLFLQQYGKSLALEKKFNDAVIVLEESKKYYRDDVWYITMGDCHEMLGHYSEAEKYYKEASFMIPHRFYPKYLLAMLYDKVGKKQEAIDLANE